MGKQFKIEPAIFIYDTCREFIENFKPGKGDLILTNPSYYKPYFEPFIKGADVVYAKDYGRGEPTDDMVNRIYTDIKHKNFKRVIAIGGGSIIDMSKLLALKNVMPVVDLYDGKLDIRKEKELVIIPTTCGTGSEVTGVSVLEVLPKGTKMGLQADALFADYAILMPRNRFCRPGPPGFRKCSQKMRLSGS